MKTRILAMTAILVCASAPVCASEVTKTSDPNWLTGADEKTRYERLEHYLGGFSTAMQETGQRYGHTAQAIVDKNWELAHYHWKKIAEVVEKGLMKRPARRPNAEKIFLNGPWGKLDQSLTAKDDEAIRRSFDEARGACMACHAAEKVPFMNDQPLFRALPVKER